MATVKELDLLLEKFSINFKTFIASWINGDLLCNSVSEKVDCKMRKLINSLRYWSGKFRYLKHERLILLTTFSLDDTVKISYTDILRNLEVLVNLDAIEELFMPENCNYIGIYFKSAATCKQIKDSFTTVDEAHIVNVDWYDELSLITGRLHYVPPFIKQVEIGELLSKFLFNLKINKLSYSDYKGIKLNSSVISFSGIIKTGLSIDSIPHFVEFAKNEVLITVKGRAPICTRCRKVGHVRKECSYSYCVSCHSMAQKGHYCVNSNMDLSYADIAKLSIMLPNPSEILNHRNADFCKQTQEGGQHVNGSLLEENSASKQNDEGLNKVNIHRPINGDMKTCTINNDNSSARINVIDHDFGNASWADNCGFEEGDRWSSIIGNFQSKCKIIMEKKKLQNIKTLDQFNEAQISVDSVKSYSKSVPLCSRTPNVIDKAVEESIFTPDASDIFSSEGEEANDNVNDSEDMDAYIICRRSGKRKFKNGDLMKKKEKNEEQFSKCVKTEVQEIEQTNLFSSLELVSDIN